MWVARMSKPAQPSGQAAKPRGRPPRQARANGELSWSSPPPSQLDLHLQSHLPMQGAPSAQGREHQQAQESPSTSSERLFGLPPVVDPHTRLLILGSFPGARSLAEQRYYAHPHNQFWRLLQVNLAPATELPGDDASRLQCLHDWGVGVWDVYASCLRAGSLDSAIREPQLNDFVALARSLPQLAGIAFNGGESWKHHRLVQAQLDLPMWRLPSSSPAHASWTEQRKAEAWRAVFVQAGLLAGA